MRDVLLCLASIAIGVAAAYLLSERRCVKRRHRGGCFVLTIGPVREQTEPVAATPALLTTVRGPVMAAFVLSDSQQTTVRIAAQDKKGNPATFDGVPTWGTDNTDVLALTPSADGLTCVVTAVGPLGTGKVSVTADADMGTGVTAIIGTLDVTVGPGAATVVVLTPEPAVEIP